jgi:hypothetical protein
MNKSESIGKLTEALSKAQAAIRGARKDSQNPHYKSRYADLASVWDACRDALSTNGLAVMQPVHSTGQQVTVTTMLAHLSGEWVACDLTVTAAQATPQAVGSAVTYARRYGLASMVGVAPDDDDDGEVAEGRGPNREASPARKPTLREALKPAPSLEDQLKASVEANEAKAKARQLIQGAAEALGGEVIDPNPTAGAFRMPFPSRKGLWKKGDPIASVESTNLRELYRWEKASPELKQAIVDELQKRDEAAP